MLIEEAYDYIESLPDHRHASIGIGFSRLEDRRRMAVPKDEWRYYIIDISVALTPEEEEKIGYTNRFKLIKSRNENLNTALEQAVNQMREFLNG